MPDIKPLSLSEFFNAGPVQYIIPPYQRTITWPKSQWANLIEDVLNLCNNPHKTHLLQMFQLQSDTTGSKLAVGDGQQRIVHTSLILIALVYALEEIIKDNENLDAINSAKISVICTDILPLADSQDNGLLSFCKNINGSTERLPRITVTSANRKIYNALLQRDWTILNEEVENKELEKSIIQHSFEFYKGEIKSYLLTDVKFPEDCHIVTNRAKNIVHTIQRQLVFGAAYFSTDEDMQASYENTNSRSVPLTGSELIKNHIFKHFHPVSQQEYLVEKYWIHFDNNYWINKDLGDRKLYQKASNRRADADDRLDLLFHYHLIALTKEIIPKGEKNEHKTFKDFKKFYEKETQSIHNGKSSEILTSVEKKGLSNFYENLLKQLFKEASLYQKLDMNGIDHTSIDHGNPFEVRALKFHRLVIKACKMPQAYSILFALMNKGFKNEEIDEFLSIVESFAIRKYLSQETLLISYLLKMSLPYIEKTSLNLKKMKADLLKNSTKSGSWEGDSNILSHQKTLQWRSKDHGLATTLLIEFENAQNNVVSGLQPEIPRLGKNLEHFMPQKSANPYTEWPLTDSEEKQRINLIYNLGNFFPLTTKINNELGNKSYKEKKDILRKYVNENGKIGIVSLDLILDSQKWGSEQIYSRLNSIINFVSKNYPGPKQTIKRFGGSILLVEGIVESDDSIFYLKKDNTYAEAIVHPDGSILYNGKIYVDFSNLTRAVEPSASTKDCISRWKVKVPGGSQLISIKDKKIALGIS